MRILKIKNLMCGLILTGAAVSGGSAALGASARESQKEKQLAKATKLFQTEFNKTYKKTLDTLTLKANYEKIYLQSLSLNSIKKVVPQSR